MDLSIISILSALYCLVSTVFMLEHKGDGDSWFMLGVTSIWLELEVVVTWTRFKGNSDDEC